MAGCARSKTTNSRSISSTPATKRSWTPSSSARDRASLFDKAVDLAVAEQPLVVLLDHLVGVTAARADLRAVCAVLHDAPVRAHCCPIAVERDHDVGDEMNAAWPRLRPFLAQAAGEIGDRRAAGGLAEGGVPGAILGEQRTHLRKLPAIESEAVFGQHLADRIL